MAKDEAVERVTSRTAAPAPAGPKSTAAPARVEEHETPSAEDAAAIAASTVFEPDTPSEPVDDETEPSEPGAGEDEAVGASAAEPAEGAPEGSE
jgi:hypothetical protein